MGPQPAEASTASWEPVAPFSPQLPSMRCQPLPAAAGPAVLPAPCTLVPLTLPRVCAAP